MHEINQKSRDFKYKQVRRVEWAFSISNGSVIDAFEDVLSSYHNTFSLALSVLFYHTCSVIGPGKWKRVLEYVVSEFR